jgi:hypothetical protein
VAFRLFGILPGYVGLRGRIEPVGGGGDTVKVFFDRPVLSFAGCLNIRIGGAIAGAVTPRLDAPPTDAAPRR